MLSQPRVSWTWSIGFTLAALFLSFANDAPFAKGQVAAEEQDNLDAAARQRKKADTAEAQNEIERLEQQRLDATRRRDEASVRLALTQVRQARQQLAALNKKPLSEYREVEKRDRERAASAEKQAKEAAKAAEKLLKEQAKPAKKEKSVKKAKEVDTKPAEPELTSDEEEGRGSRGTDGSPDEDDTLNLRPISFPDGKSFLLDESTNDLYDPSCVDNDDFSPVATYRGNQWFPLTPSLNED